MRAVRKQCSRNGFSLLELLIVLAIMAVIAALVVPQLLGRQESASVRTTEASIHHLEMAAKLYRAQHDSTFPEGGEEVYELLLAPTDKNGRPLPPYLESIPTDAWGEPLSYLYPPTRQSVFDRPDIWSSGPNGIDDNGEGDDINNWDVQEDSSVVGSIRPL